MEKDQFGPEYIIKVHDARLEMEGFLVIDNTALGPGKGGIRMTPDITEEEVWRLARTMTWKNALAGVPFGGAKAGIRWPGGSEKLKKEFIQSFARAVKPFIPHRYIAGPDVNTGAKEMQWFVEATGVWSSATGKPEHLCLEVLPGWVKCGIPHEVGSTGFGVVQATKVAAEIAGIDIKKAAVSIHGFGNVGTSAYQFLTEMGAKVVAIADKSGAIFSKNGFDKKTVQKLIQQRKEISQYPGRAEKIKPADFWKIPVDILIPASVTNVINEQNKSQIKAKIIVEAANIPMKDSIEEEMFRKGILVVPDIVANSGGVISSYSEYRGYHLKKMFELVERKIKDNSRMILEESLKRNRSPNQIALEIAKKMVENKMKKRKTIF